MTKLSPRAGCRPGYARILAAFLGLLLIPAHTTLLAQQTPPSPAPSAGAAPAAPAAAPTPAAVPEAATLSADQLQALVAPIALYPDPLLAQVLVASTYPLDIVEAQQWLSKNDKLKGEELSKAAEKQPWDPSVQALVLVPDALKLLSENIKWTKDLGDVVLAQQKDVMNAVQELRRKAKADGKLESSEQQNVEETKSDSGQTVVVIQPSNPEVVYVPTYNPTVVWGAAPYYPYPPLYYPPPYYGGAFIGFGVGVAVGIGISGGWGWGCGWNDVDIDINNNNNFVNNNNRQNNVNRSGNGKWEHNAQQRGGVPYKDKATANKYGGSDRGSSSRGGASAGTMDRGAGSANRGGASAGTMDRGAGSANRGGASGGASAGTMDRSASGANRGGASGGSMDRSASAGSMDRSASSASRGSSNVGSRNVPSSSRATSSSSFGGSHSASRASSSSSRGASSMSRGGGGGRGGRR